MDRLHARYDPVLGAGRRRRPRAARGLPGLPLAVVQRRRSSSSSSRSSSARSTGRPGCGAASADVRVAQPEPFFDPRLPDRARDGRRRRRTPSGASCGAAGSGVREATADDGTRFLYGDRHQYTKLATLLTHLGLILFLVAAAVTSRLGDEQGLVVAEGESLTVQPIGTPGLLLVKNLDFEAPGLRHRPGRPTSRPTSPSTRTASEIARKTIRVNDPLSVGGYTFHQNGFGPAPHLVISDADGRPSVGRAGAADRRGVAGLPYATLAVPGPRRRPPAAARRDAPTARAMLVVLPVPRRRHGRRRHADRSRPSSRSGLAPRRRRQASPALDLSIGLSDFGEYTLLIAKRDPGQGLVWLAFALPDRRDHDHVLPAAPPGLGAARPGRAAGHRLAVGPLRRRRARVRAAARRPRRGPRARPDATGDCAPGDVRSAAAHASSNAVRY